MTPKNKISNIMRSLQYDHTCVTSILRNPLVYPGWSLQGFGMLRLYLTKEIRLHVWDSTYQVPNVSLLHDHPWDFTSVVIAGHMENRLYSQGHGTPFQYATILCGPGAGQKTEPQSILLYEYRSEQLDPGCIYHQAAEDIHASFPAPGTVTVVERFFKPDAEHARVFWPMGEQWVSAEPRPATNQEVMSICRKVVGL
jgi:hypothetical protein